MPLGCIDLVNALCRDRNSFIYGFCCGMVMAERPLKRRLETSGQDPAQPPCLERTCSQATKHQCQEDQHKFPRGLQYDNIHKKMSQGLEILHGLAGVLIPFNNTDQVQDHHFILETATRGPRLK